MHHIDSVEQFDSVLDAASGHVVIGFFGDFSEASNAALPEFTAYAAETPDTVLAVNVAKVRGLHKRYGVASVPTVIRMKGDEIKQMVVGPQRTDYYRRALTDSHFAPTEGDGTQKPSHNVTVYVSPHCVWCTRVKAHLRKHRVHFREVDVSTDPTAARRLQAKTGQTGVPQLDIDGKYIVGFDKSRIDTLLDLH